MRSLIVIFLFSSCATASVPTLENRTYDICQDLSGFCYQYKVCAKKFVGICYKHKIEVEKIEADFKNKEQAKQLFQMNFILQVRKKPF